MMARTKRAMSEEAELKILEPVLIKIDNNDCIHIDKNEFKIGRARDNDEIILDIMISRRHCIFRCKGDNEWEIKDLSSSVIFVNNIAILPGVTQKIYSGDIIQLSHNETFKYVFTLIKKEQYIKKPHIDEKILDTIITQQKTLAMNQRSEFKDKLQIKQKEQDLDLLSQQNQNSLIVKDDKKKLRQILLLENKMKTGNTQEQHFQNMYSQLLEKRLENERLQFEIRISEEKQKWQEALDMSKLENKMLEVKMKEKMKKWRKEQQIEWKNLMENKVKKEKNVQFQLMNEKTMLEKKLKETEKALREQEAKTETSQVILNENTIETFTNTADNRVLLKSVNFDQSSDVRILHMKDLTKLNESININAKENILEKVNSIMDEQLTCSICSELFIKATTLNCTHTFCYHCINMWSKKRKECPICRKSVTSMNKSLVLDNFIESMTENLPTKFKNKRKEIIQERAVKEKKKCKS